MKGNKKIRCKHALTTVGTATVYEGHYEQKFIAKYNLFRCSKCGREWKSKSP